MEGRIQPAGLVFATCVLDFSLSLLKEKKYSMTLSKMVRQASFRTIMIGGILEWGREPGFNTEYNVGK